MQVYKSFCVVLWILNSFQQRCGVFLSWKPAKLFWGIILGEPENSHKVQGIDPRLVYGKPPMQVRTGNPPRGAYFSEQLAGFQLIAGLYVYLRQVPIKCVDTQSMVDNYGVPCEKQLLGQSNLAGLRGMYWGSRGRWKIDSAMRRSRYSIQNTAFTKISASFDPLERCPERAHPQPLRCWVVIDRAESLALRSRPLGLRFVWLDILFPDGEPFRGEMS